MKLVAITPVRNEDWILGLSARVALKWCDALVVGFHSCTDASGDIISRMIQEGLPISWINLPDIPGHKWPEMVHRQMLLDEARSLRTLRGDGATHIAIVDADEILCGDSLPHIRPWAESLAPGECLNVRMHCPWRSLDKYRVDPCVWSNRRDLALVFRDAPNLHWSAGPGGYQHHARAPKGSTTRWCADIGVMHLQFADWRRLTAKHALYKVRERIDYPDKPVEKIEQMYNMALNEKGLKLSDVPFYWWDEHCGMIETFDLQSRINTGVSIPWQEAEVRRLVEIHGREKFAGLSLFGLA